MRTGSGKAGKNEQVTLEIEEPERLCGGAEGVSARGGARSARRSTGNPRHVETLHNSLKRPLTDTENLLLVDERNILHILGIVWLWY